MSIAQKSTYIRIAAKKGLSLAEQLPLPIPYRLAPLVVLHNEELSSLYFGGAVCSAARHSH
jgi:hypothetical protein